MVKIDALTRIPNRFIFEITLKQALLIAEKLRTTIESESLITESDPLTISLGVTESQKEDTQDKIFARVDEALYQAKKNGRNCVSS